MDILVVCNLPPLVSMFHQLELAAVLLLPASQALWLFAMLATVAPSKLCLWTDSQTDR